MINGNIIWIIIAVVVFIIFIVILFPKNKSINNEKYTSNHTSSIDYQNSNIGSSKETDDEIDGWIDSNNYHNRNFYATSAQHPNDQSGFAKWLYRAPPTCKEDPTQCLKYEDVRFSKYNPDIDTPSDT